MCRRRGGSSRGRVEKDYYNGNMGMKEREGVEEGKRKRKNCLY